jgi:hypothetical protein
MKTISSDNGGEASHAAGSANDVNVCIWYGIILQAKPIQLPFKAG